MPFVVIVIVLLNNFLLFINMSDKQKIINDIYFDRSGFGSRKTTLEDSRRKDASITMDDVNKFFRLNVEIKKETTRH